MLKDIYTIQGWYTDSTLTLLRNDRKKIPINLKGIDQKGFTWYYEGEIEEDPLVDPNPTNPDTPTPTDPDEPVVQPAMCLVSIDTLGEGVASLSSTSVLKGSTVRVTATPDEGWQIESVKTTTGEPLTGSNNVYTLTVLQDTSIFVVFSTDPNYSRPDDPEPEEPEPNSIFTVTTSAGLNGFAGFVKGSTYDRERSQLFLAGTDVTIHGGCKTGYVFDKLIINGTEVRELTGEKYYTIPNINQDISAIWVVKNDPPKEVYSGETLYTITIACEGEGDVLIYYDGTNNPTVLYSHEYNSTANVQIKENGYVSFRMYPRVGYEIKGLWRNGVKYYAYPDFVHTYTGIKNEDIYIKFDKISDTTQE